MKGKSSISFHDLGVMLHVPGLMALVSIAVAAACRDWLACKAFLTIVILSVGIGQALCRSFKRSKVLEPYKAMCTVALAWLIAGLLSAVPFWAVGSFSPEGSENALSYASPASAVFEGFSGITSCGLTMSANPNLLSPALQWWRSLLEWIGGVGVVVLALTLTDRGSDPEELFEAEARSSTKAGVKALSVTIWKIYLAFTVLTVTGLCATGMPAWEALNHGLTAISTGGFTITANGFGNYGPATLVVTIVAMIIGATSFQLHSAVWMKKNWRASFHNTQFRWLISGIAGGSIVLFLAVHLAGGSADNMTVLFQWVSALCTCGFSADNLSNWPAGPLLLIIVAMVVGGAAGSTAGGVKIRRIAWIVKGMWRYAIHSMHEEKPQKPFLQDGKEISFAEGRKFVRAAALLLGIWLSTLTVGSVGLLLILPEAVPHHVIFEVVSAIGGVGLSTGIASASIPSAAKLLLAALMWTGRLEIIAVLSIIIRPCFKLFRY